MAFGEYEGGLRGLIHLLKYDAVAPVASVLGACWPSTIEELLPACGDSMPLIVPVPLHKSKRSDRGFNHEQKRLILRENLRNLLLPIMQSKGMKA